MKLCNDLVSTRWYRYGTVISPTSPLAVKVAASGDGHGCKIVLIVIVIVIVIVIAILIVIVIVILIVILMIIVIIFRMSLTWLCRLVDCDSVLVQGHCRSGQQG